MTRINFIQAHGAIGSALTFQHVGMLELTPSFPMDDTSASLSDKLILSVRHIDADKWKGPILLLHERVLFFLWV